MSGDIFVCHNLGMGVLTSSSEQGPGMLPNSLQRTGYSHTTKNDLTNRTETELKCFSRLLTLCGSQILVVCIFACTLSDSVASEFTDYILRNLIKIYTDIEEIQVDSLKIILLDIIDYIMNHTHNSPWRLIQGLTACQRLGRT